VKTNWDDLQINPYGLRAVGGQTSTPLKEIRVTVKAKALVYFKDKSGHSYVCASLNADKRRAAFIDKGHGYEEMEDRGLAFTIARMTDEIGTEHTK
jgi:hypothetical protein